MSAVSRKYEYSARRSTWQTSSHRSRHLSGNTPDLSKWHSAGLLTGQQKLSSIILRGAKYFKNKPLQVELCAHLLQSSNEVSVGNRATQWYAYNVIVGAFGSLPKQLAAFEGASCGIQRRSSEVSRRLKRMFETEDPPSPASLQIFRSLPPAHSLSSYLDLQDLHRLALVSRSWYGWVFGVELKTAWQHIIMKKQAMRRSGDHVEWIWEWSDWDPEASSNVALQVRHHHVFTPFRNRRSKSNETSSSFLIKGEEGVPEMWCPVLWDAFEKNPRREAEQVNASRFLRETQNGNDLVTRQLLSTVPDWTRIFVCSMASAAAGILHHKSVQKSEYYDKDESEWYIFVPFSVQNNEGEPMKISGLEIIQRRDYSESRYPHY